MATDLTVSNCRILVSNFSNPPTRHFDMPQTMKILWGTHKGCDRRRFLQQLQTTFNLTILPTIVRRVMVPDYLTLKIGSSTRLKINLKEQALHDLDSAFPHRISTNKRSVPRSYAWGIVTSASSLYQHSHPSLTMYSKAAPSTVSLCQLCSSPRSSPPSSPPLSSPCLPARTPPPFSAPRTSTANPSSPTQSQSTPSSPTSNKTPTTKWTPRVYSPSRHSSRRNFKAC